MLQFSWCSYLSIRKSIYNGKPITSNIIRLSYALVCIIGTAALHAHDLKLSEDNRVEILRGLTAEYATVKVALPRSTTPLRLDSTGTWDRLQWDEAEQKNGSAAQVGVLVEITRVTIESDKILLEINGGMKGKGHWYDHVQIGMGTQTGPISPQQSASVSSGSNIALLFNKLVPALNPADIKKLLAPILDFDTQTVTENYVETLPEVIQKAIKANRAIEGMDRDQVLLALGRPRHKERSVSRDGTETEDWIYGEPPGKITFLTFAGAKVTEIQEAYATIGGWTAPPLQAQ